MNVNATKNRYSYRPSNIHLDGGMSSIFQTGVFITKKKKDITKLNLGLTTVF